MVRFNDQQLNLEANQTADIYEKLTQELFYDVVKRLKERGPVSLEENPYIWQLDKMSKMGMLNNDTVKKISELSGIAEEQLRNIIQKEGFKIYKDTAEQLRLNNPLLDSSVQQDLADYASQAMGDVSNLINTTLPKSVQAVYKSIVEQTVASVITGLKTPDRALNDTIMRWFDKGFYGFTDKAGKRWKADVYARTIIKSTTYRVYNEMRMRPAEELGIDTYYYSKKATARAMCAPLQGRIVTTGEARTIKGVKVLSLNDYGYGTPGGCRGINCGHVMTPFIVGVNELSDQGDDIKNISEEDAIKNANVQAKQRALERTVRDYKGKLDLAKELDDDKLIEIYGNKVKLFQAKLRGIVRDNSFLHRDYAREKYYK